MFTALQLELSHEEPIGAEQAEENSPHDLQEQRQREVVQESTEKAEDVWPDTPREHQQELLEDLPSHDEDTENNIETGLLSSDDAGLDDTSPRDNNSQHIETGALSSDYTGLDEFVHTENLSQNIETGVLSFDSTGLDEINPSENKSQCIEEVTETDGVVETKESEELETGQLTPDTDTEDPVPRYLTDQ